MLREHQIGAQLFDIGLRTGTILLLSMVITTCMIAAPSAHSQTFTVIYNFTGGTDGGDPMTGLTMDRAGNLYGTTWGGGGGFGTVFKLAHRGSDWVMKPLYSFHGGLDGAGPSARVIIGPDGALYGTTNAGGGGTCGYFGYSGCGTVFRLQPPPTFCRAVLCPWTEQVIYTAHPNGGRFLFGEVVFDPAGNLYTTVYGGGLHYSGYVIELTPSHGSWISTVIHYFDLDSGDAAYPQAGLVIDQSGHLYGTSTRGGDGLAAGTVFELSPNGSGWTETLLHSFQETDGNEPQAPLIFDRQGNLYGTTFAGGPNQWGVVFELSPTGQGWTFNLLWSFAEQGDGGDLLRAPVSVDVNGNLYGTTFHTGCCGAGTVFELSPASGGWSETVLHTFFNGNDGGYPYSNVVVDVQGHAYGTTSIGGAYGKGVIWEITP